ncbi:MAG: 4'-phosphopantetheinyl transferase superfamily protein [Caldilineaceae bacterium]|nr:4'-phosphopantetheinyl transferase superfamily protein [Caldilineaceae bacterium]
MSDATDPPQRHSRPTDALCAQGGTALEHPVTELPGLFDDSRVCVLTSPVRDAELATLSEREREMIANAVSKRRNEFATGRHLARLGLARYFGITGFDLLNAKDRSPQWPVGVSGSIAHSDRRAWVALVDSAIATVGIDGESRPTLEPNLWRMILREEEQAYIQRLDPAIRGRRALTIFSAKEALYKAQFPQSRQFMGFMALRVELHEGGRLDCHFQTNVGPYRTGFTASGRWLDNGDIVTAVWIATV